MRPERVNRTGTPRSAHVPGLPSQLVEESGHQGRLVRDGIGVDELAPGVRTAPDRTEPAQDRKTQARDEVGVAGPTLAA